MDEARTEPAARTQPPTDSEPGPIGDSTLVDTIAAARSLGIDATSWSFEQLMEANKTLREYSKERENRERQAELDNRETIVRFTLALLLVLGSVLGVFAGIVAGLGADEVAQFLAPITGLAGIAVGYFFGRASQVGGGPPVPPRGFEPRFPP
jgi:hypothetical protein